MSETPPSPHAATSAANPTPATPVRAAERRRRQVGWRTSDVLRAAAAVIGMYLVLRLIWVAQTVFLTAFLGVLFGLAVSAGVDWLRTRVRASSRAARRADRAWLCRRDRRLLRRFGSRPGDSVAELQTKLPEAIDKIDHVGSERQRAFWAR